MLRFRHVVVSLCYSLGCCGFRMLMNQNVAICRCCGVRVLWSHGDVVSVRCCSGRCGLRCCGLSMLWSPLRPQVVVVSICCCLIPLLQFLVRQFSRLLLPRVFFYLNVNLISRYFFLRCSIVDCCSPKVF
jgi:hypothetical protein